MENKDDEHKRIDSQNDYSDDDNIVEEIEYDSDDDDGVMESPDLFSDTETDTADSPNSSDETDYSEYNPFDEENRTNFSDSNKEISHKDEDVIDNKEDYEQQQSSELDGSEENISEDNTSDDDDGIMESPEIMNDEASESFENTDNSINDSENDSFLEEKKDDNNEILSFEEHKKMSADAADSDKPKSKPKKLNKKFLLTAIVTVFCVVFVVAFIMPTKNSRKKNNEEKPVAEQHTLMDYSQYAKRQEEESEIQNHYAEPDVSYSNNSANGSAKEPKKEVVIPPVIPESSKQPYAPASYSSPSTTTAIEIPDTRNDRLQGKMISGIKGLTSTQQSYSTDYQKTIEKNTNSTTSTGQYGLPSKEEYMNNILNAYSSAYGNAAAGNNNYAVQNDQSGKNKFYNSNRDNAGQGEWLNLNTIWQGTIFEATLTSAINTDLPGEITARVAKNIYSSQDGRFLLIPQNSILYGTYNSSISYAQSRVQVQWNTLIRPDGYKIELGGMNGTDAQGASGLKGFINDHPMAYLKAIALMSTVSIANSEFAAAASKYNDNEYIQNVIANTQEVANELGDKLIDRAMNVQPTIKIKEGTKINIVVNTTLSLPPYEEIPVTQKYERRK